MKNHRQITAIKPITNLPDGRSTYVPVRDPRGDELPLLAQQADMLPMQPVTEQIVGTPVNRALAFNLRTLSLSIVIGLALWLIGGGLIARFPLFSLAAVAFFVTGFVIVWLIAFRIDAQHSPAGIALYNAKERWAFLKREQEERHRRMRDER